MPTTWDDVLKAEEHERETRENYLCQRGWKAVCDLPGSQWLWRKEVRGHVVTVDAHSAAYMQANDEVPDEPIVD